MVVLPAVQFQFKSRLMQDFQRNIMFLSSQFWDIVSMLCPSVIPQSYIHDAQPTPRVTKIRAVRRCASMHFVRI